MSDNIGELKRDNSILINEDYPLNKRLKVAEFPYSLKDKDSVVDEIRMTENTKIDFQVATGIFVPCELIDHALVVSDGWPSWTFALDGLGFKSLSTVASFQSLSSRDEFRSTSLGKTLIKRDRIKRWIEEHKRDGILFIQGPRETLKTIENLSNEFTELRLIFCCNDTEFFTADGWRESHADAGGVTDGTWTCYSQNLDLSPKEANPVRRNLRHVLRTTEGASSKRALTRCHSQPSMPDERTKWKLKMPSVITFSVFDKTGPVHRLITIEELLDIYDMELMVQAELKNFWKDQGVKPTRSFVDQVPIKVLRSLASRLVNELKPKPVLDQSEDTSSIDSDTTVRHQNLKSIINAKQGDEDIDYDTDDGSLANELLPDTDNKSLPDRAACPDDKEADAEDWDIWMVENFVDLNSKKEGLVCTGTYDKEAHAPFFEAFRKLLIRRYRKNVLSSFLSYLKSEYYLNKMVKIYVPTVNKSVKVPKWTVVNRLGGSGKRREKSELLKDLEVGRDAVGRAAQATWWNWDGGSTLFFWRWPKWSKSSVRDGTKLFVDWSLMPSYWKRQKWPDDEAACNKLKKKLSNVRGKGYVQPGFVKILTSYFAVPKAKTDIRVVYDATACGLNDSLWAPNFFLPTVDSILRNASSSTWFGDIDLGEMFLNYPLDEAIRPYAGVDVSNVDLTELDMKGIRRIIERWVRCLMGFKPSPYITTQTFAWGEEIIQGNRLDPTNPFFWDKLILNLPGTPNYQPDKPWVYKWNSLKKIMASFFGTYIDDIRGGGSNEIECRRTIHRTACRINYLGQQEAPRKRGQATQNPRAWAGSRCIAIEGEGLYVLSMEEKWFKSKKIIEKLYQHVVETKSSLLNYKSLESDVGFLCHVSRTYPIIFPYLKGFYNTLNNWRCDRNEDGWKISRTAWMELLAGDIVFEDESDIDMSFDDRKRDFKKRHHKDQPAEVAPVPRLTRDLLALRALFKADTPQLRLIRGLAICYALFGFGDASGGGFGSSWEVKQGTAYRYGTWSRSMDGESSNLRELTNLVDTLKEMADQDELKGKEIFLFTDNSTSEAAYYSGSSSSEKLFDLVLRVKLLEMNSLTKIHLIHVSGEQMKE